MKRREGANKNGVCLCSGGPFDGGLLLPLVSKNVMISAYRKMIDKFGFISEEKIDEEVTRWIDELKIVTPSGPIACAGLVRR